jgi:hypothetical protein
MTEKGAGMTEGGSGNIKEECSSFTVMSNN